MFRKTKAESLTPNMDRAERRLNGRSEHPTRRTVLKGILGTAALLYAGGNEYMEHWAAESYKSRGTELEMVGGQNIKSNLLAVSFGGEGDWNDFWGAQTFFQDSGKRIPSANMYYDNKNGLDFVSQARVLKQAQKNRGFEYLVVNAGSEGGLIACYTALLAGIPVAGFIANSCPAQLSDAKSGAVLSADLITSPDNPNSPLVRNFELWSKDMWCYFRDNPLGQAIDELPHELESLPSQMASGGSPNLQVSQLQFLEWANSSLFVPELVKHGIMSKDFTSPIFLEAANDDTIDPLPSYRHWHRDFERHEMEMPRLFMGPDSIHADVFTEGTPLHQIGYYDLLISRFDTPHITSV